MKPQKPPPPTTPAPTVITQVPGYAELSDADREYLDRMMRERAKARDAQRKPREK